MKAISALVCGVIFGVGLALSGMTDVGKVIGFLDLFGAWDPTLMFVMGAGLLVSFPFFQFGIAGLKKPVFAEIFRLPTKQEIDARLIMGACLFGTGWGLVGLCPGPAIASLAYLNVEILYFVVAMSAGMLLAQLFTLVDAD